MSPATKKRTRLTPEARHSQLLDVAKDIIVSDGLQAFSMEALARAAGVSSPLVYKYLPSRAIALQSLLQREYAAFTDSLTREIAEAASFEDVVRIFVVSNFDHYAPGNIIPVLDSQPEIAEAIKEQGARHGRNVARYLVEQAASTYELSRQQAELVVKMSSGASIAAAQYASSGRINRNKAIDAALAYILAGLERTARGDT